MCKCASGSFAHIPIITYNTECSRLEKSKNECCNTEDARALVQNIIKCTTQGGWVGGLVPPFFVPRELAYPAHHMVLDTRSRKEGSELSGATMIPQMTVVADLTRSEDLLSLKPGYAVGDCHAHRRPSVHEAQ